MLATQLSNQDKQPTIDVSEKIVKVHSDCSNTLPKFEPKLFQFS